MKICAVAAALSKKKKKNQKIKSPIEKCWIVLVNERSLNDFSPLTAAILKMQTCHKAINRIRNQVFMYTSS